MTESFSLSRGSRNSPRSSWFPSLLGLTRNARIATLLERSSTPTVEILPPKPALSGILSAMASLSIQISKTVGALVLGSSLDLASNLTLEAPSRGGYAGFGL